MGQEPAIKVLTDAHRRLVADQQQVCERSGVPWRYIEQSAVVHCQGTELAWLMAFHEHGRPGLVLVGDRAIDRIMAIAGALVRNFVDARVRTAQQVMDDPVQATVLLVPNLHTLESKDLPAWKAEKLYDQLLDRFRQDLPTVVWVHSLQAVKADLGVAMYDLLCGFHLSKGQ
jgi:hypothetical protein